METNTLAPSRELDARIMGLLGVTMSMVASVPAYSTDMNAAVVILQTELADFSLIYDGFKKEWQVSDGVSDYWVAQDAAMAICKAFISVKEYDNA